MLTLHKERYFIAHWVIPSQLLLPIQLWNVLYGKGRSAEAAILKVCCDRGLNSSLASIAERSTAETSSRPSRRWPGSKIYPASFLTFSAPHQRSNALAMAEAQAEFSRALTLDAGAARDGAAHRRLTSMRPCLSRSKTRHSATRCALPESAVRAIMRKRTPVSGPL